MNWSQILANTAQYPNDLKFTINGQEVSLGDIRTQNDQSRGEVERKLNERQSQLDHVARQQSAATDNLARIVENVQRVTGLSIEDITQGRIPENMRGAATQAAANTQSATGGLMRDDPLYRPVFEALEPQLKQIDLQGRVLKRSLDVYANDRARLDYLEFMQFERPNDEFKPKLDEVLNAAVQKGYKNSEGWPDVPRAMREMAEPLRQKASIEDVRKQALEEGRRQALAEQAAQLGQPSMFGGTEFSSQPEPQKAGGPVASIRDQLSKAFADPQILASQTVQ